MRSVLPLLEARLDLPWSNMLNVSDSSHLGFGVCERPVSSQTIWEIGRVSDAWRWDFEGSVQARQSALGEQRVSAQESEHLAYDSNKRFPDAPPTC